MADREFGTIAVLDLHGNHYVVTWAVGHLASLVSHTKSGRNGANGTAPCRHAMICGKPDRDLIDLGSHKGLIKASLQMVENR